MRNRWMNSTLLFGLTAMVLATSAWAQPRMGGLEKSDPIRCSGSRDVIIRGKIIETDGSAVVASGSCDVRIVDSRIIAGGPAIAASGASDVRIENSHVEGHGAIVASGSSDVVYMNSVLVGGVSTSGSADVIDRGGNQMSSDHSAGSGGSARENSGGSGIVIDGGPGGGIQVGDIRIDESGVRMPGVVVDESGVRAGGASVTTDAAGNVRIGAPGANVVVDGDHVRIGAGGSAVEVSGDWRTVVSSNYDTETVLVELGAVQGSDGWRLNLAGDVLFDFDSTAIRGDAGAQLSKVAHVIRDRAAGDVIVVGHTDAVGDESYNQSLSEQRALAVMQWLNQRESIPVGVMKGRGMGERQPIAHNTKPDGTDDPNGRAQNRRVEIAFAGR